LVVECSLKFPIKKAAIMAAFFYFRDMETLQALYNLYDSYIIGDKIKQDHANFELHVAGLQAHGDTRFIYIDSDLNGKDFFIEIKTKSQRLSASFLTVFLSEIKNHPNPLYFKIKHIKKIGEIKEALALKYPQFSFFVTDIEEMLEELEIYMSNQMDLGLLKIDKIDRHVKYQKIKWLGKTNVLTTLFYDMLNGQDRRSSLIEATQEDIKGFLMNNFLDADGNELTLDTIVTYMRSDKAEKRAKIGDRIELGNVKLKNKKEL